MVVRSDVIGMIMDMDMDMIMDMDMDMIMDMK